MVFVLLDNVKSFDMSNKKATEGQISERKIKSMQEKSFLNPPFAVDHILDNYFIF